MMSMRFLFSRTRRALVGAGLLLLVALAVACGGGGGGGGDPRPDPGRTNEPGFQGLPTRQVNVAANAERGDTVLIVTVENATLSAFPDRSGFMSAGGARAAIALASDATAIFDFDDKVASLTLSVTNSVGAATATIRFVSAPRFFTDDLLSISVTATNAVAGATILSVGAASISIWHNGAADERYEISPDDGNFGVDSETGLVTAAANLTPDATYNLTLSLIDDAGNAVPRSLRVIVGALFVDLPASPVVAAAVDVGDAILTITVAGATLQSFARSGFRSAGGEMATISLVSDPVSIFTFDNAVVSLTITLSDSRRTIAATVRFMSAPRVITADLLTISVAALEAVAGATILAVGAAEISIWHNGTMAIEEYKIFHRTTAISAWIRRRDW